MSKISCDIDDTLVAFYSHYESRFGPVKTDSEITRNVVGVLKKDKGFWLSQPLINRPNFKVHNYCTARVIPKTWIREQIKINNLPKAPIYQVFGFGLSKFSQLRRSGADVHIDDSIRVWKDLNSKGFPCLLLDTPYNQNLELPFGRIYSVDKDEIEEVFHIFKRTVFPNFKEIINE